MGQLERGAGTSGGEFFLYSLAGHYGWILLDIPGGSRQLIQFLALTALAGMGLGLVSAWANGCPTRQHVAAGQGDSSARFYLVGFYIGVVLFYMLVSPALESVL